MVTSDDLEFNKVMNESVNPDDLEFNQLMRDSVKTTALENKVKDTKYVGGVAYFVPTEIGEDANVLDKFWYYNNQIGTGILSGVNKAVGSTGRFMIDVLGLPVDKAPIEEFEQELSKNINSTTGQLAETASQVGVGLFATRGMGAGGVGSRLAQGGIIDGIFFSEKDDNIANVLDDLGIKNSVVEFLKVDKDSETPLYERAKSAISGGAIGAGLEGLVGIVRAMKYGKEALQAKYFAEKPDGTMEDFLKTLQSKSDEDLIREAYGASKGQMDEVATSTGLKKTAEFADEAPTVDATIVTKTPEQSGTELLDRVTKIIDDKVQANPENLTINTTKLSDSPTAPKVAEDLDSDLFTKTHVETAQEVQKYLVNQIKDKGIVSAYDEVNKLLKATKGLSFKVEVAKTMVASVFKDFDNALTKYRSAPSAEGFMDIISRLENLDQLIKMNKTGIGRVAQALSQAGFETKNAPMVRLLQVADAIDPESKLRILKKVGDATDPEMMKIIQGFADESLKLQDALVGVRDGRATRFMNVVAEQGVAGMLSGFSTLAVGVLGSGIMRALDLSQDLLKYGYGVGRNGIEVLTGHPVTKRMQFQEVKSLIHSNTVQTVYDLKDTFRVLQSWFNSGFKDDTFDRALLSPMIQDNPTHKHYITAEYLRGRAGEDNTLVNKSIDVYGKIIRAPYKAIALPDDWMKRGFFRNELVRQGYQVADHMRIPYEEQAKWVDNFVKANTELQILRNNNKTPTKEWAKLNADYIGKGENKYVYSELARERANYGTFQSEIKGWMGDAVSLLNHNGLLRVLVPFKTTTVNLLKASYKETLGTIGKDLIEGGMKGDMARAKATIGVGLMWTAWSLAESGRITGTFLPKERSVMESSGIKENVWIDDDGKMTEYKQLEPLATILSFTADLNNMVKSLSYRFKFLPEDQIMEEAKQVSAEFISIIANNITNKTFTKSLADNFDFLFGEKPITDLVANVMNSSLPYSGLVNFTGRMINHDGSKFEAKTFLEKAFRNYRFMLDRPALDPFGKEIDEISYNPVLLKTYKFDPVENRAGIEMSRLGVDANLKVKNLSVKGMSIPLQPEQLWEMNRSLDTELNYKETMNELIDSKSYQEATDFVKRELLDNVKSKIHNKAIDLAKARYVDKIEKAIDIKIDKIDEPKIPSKYDGVINEIKGLADGGQK